MNNDQRYASGSLQYRLTLLFLLMGAALSALVFGYWFMGLEPRLLADAKASAGALAQSQSHNLASALADAISQHDSTPLQDAMDEILVLTDPGTERPFVVMLELTLDYGTVDLPTGSLDIERGEWCDQCFISQIPLFALNGGQLLGVVQFHSSSAFFEEIRNSVRTRLLLVGVGVLALWLLGWRAVSRLFRAMRESERTAAYAIAQERGAAVERERIARDLHDDVAPQLLTLTYSTESAEYAERANQAMQTLRESIYMLSDPRDVPLKTALAEWRAEVAERAESAGVHLCWKLPSELPSLTLTSRERLNLGRVMREAVSNAWRHAEPSVLNITAGITNVHLVVRLSHDGHITAPETWLAGKGLCNMRARIAELGGNIEWRLSDTSMLTVEWVAPIFLADQPVEKQ